MKKFIFYLSLLFVFAIFIYTNLFVSDIKTVSATYIKTQEYTPQINVNGEFESKDSVTLIMSYPLYIKEVYVSENTYVTKGQALFSIDKEKMIKIINGQESVDISQLGTNSQLIKYLSNQTNVSALDSLPEMVYATEEGIVQQLNITPESLSLPEQHLMTINCSDKLMARFSLSQLDYGKISIGDEVNITPIAFSNARYNGIISEENAVVKKQTSMNGSRVVVDVFAEIENPDKKIAEGMQINGTINLGKSQIINGLDYTYIYQDEVGQYVMLYNDGKAKKVYVQTGVEVHAFTQLLNEFDKNTIFLKGNIEEGDRVIISTEQ